MKTRGTARRRTSTFSAAPVGLLQRKCDCGKSAGLTGNCSECQGQRLMTKPDSARRGSGAPILHELIQAKLTIGAPNDKYEQEADRVATRVMRMPDAEPMPPEEKEEEEKVQMKPLSSIMPLVQREANLDGGVQVDSAIEGRLNSSKGGGSPLPEGVRSFMEPRFGADFSGVRVHTGGDAVQMNRDLQAKAFTHGHDIYYSGGNAPANDELTAHELTHVVQQEGGFPSSVHDVRFKSIEQSMPMIQLRLAPYIKKIRVHLDPPQNANLEWEGTPPAEATGSDHFTVSTGKGYSDPDDPRGTCTRTCCGDPETQCAPPWNQPGRVGACCTYFGNTFWTGTPLKEHNGWLWWTPIQPYYSSRGIALHQHIEVTGQPIGHGCVRMDEENAKRIYDFSNGKKTNVTIDGRAAPVGCEENRRCASSSSTQGSLDENLGGNRVASEVQEAVAGLEQLS